MTENISSSYDIATSEWDAGKRLDRLLALHITDFSRSRLKALIQKGQLSIDDQVITAPSHSIKAGQLIRLILPPLEEALPEPQNIPLDILYEDNHLIVINKPAGLVTHPGAGNWDGTLVNALLYHCADSLSGIGGVERPGIVHRLDKDTSGVMVCAKNDKTHHGLSEQFADHGRNGPLQRAYKALVWQAPPRQSGIIDLPIARDPHHRTLMKVAQHGKMARTHYQRLQSFVYKDKILSTLVRCNLETGRTHQIRVHMAHHHCPIVGDPDYGTGFKSKIKLLPDTTQPVFANFTRQALHAFLLTFRHPITDEVMHFEQPIPADMQGLIDELSVIS